MAKSKQPAVDVIRAAITGAQIDLEACIALLASRGHSGGITDSARARVDELVAAQSAVDELAAAVAK